MSALKAFFNPTRLIAAAVIVALALGAYTFWPRTEPTKVTAEFSRAVGLFPGSDVRILGVKVGQVDSVTPAGNNVRVTFSFDSKYQVPADAQAAVVAPSLVSDRYVQLLPVYRNGPTLASGANIPLSRTAVPVELDQISSSLNNLMVALGPQGANKDGALSRLVDTSAANLDGNGQKLHDTIQGLSQAVQTLDEGKGDLFGTVKNLQSFTAMLAANDQQVQRLNKDLADVSTQLDAERGDLSAALKNLAVALNEVSTFVKDNRSLIKSDVDQLTSVTTAVAAKRQALAETLTNAPVALSNLQLAYNPVSGTLDTRMNLAQLSDPALLLCSMLSGPTGNVNSPLCTTLSTVLKGLPPLPTIPGVTGSATPSAFAKGASPAPSGSAGSASGASGATAVGQADPTLGGLLPSGGN